MILNLLRVEELRVEDMMRRSFAEFHIQRDSQQRRRMMEKLGKQLKNVKDVDCVLCNSDLKDYFRACSELNELTLHLKVREEMEK